MCIIVYVSEKKSKILLKTILEKLIKTEQEVKLKEKRKKYDYIGVKINETGNKYWVDKCDQRKGLLIYSKATQSNKRKRSIANRTFRQRENKMLCLISCGELGKYGGKKILYTLLSAIV